MTSFSPPTDEEVVAADKAKRLGGTLARDDAYANGVKHSGLLPHLTECEHGDMNAVAAAADGEAALDNPNTYEMAKNAAVIVC